MITDSAILKKIERQPRQSAGFKQLVRELGLHGDQRRELSARLSQLVQRGDLVASDTRYAIPKAKPGKGLVVGRLTMHRDGYGFVIPDSKSLKDRISGDIFINPQAIGPAMHGDQVLVELGPVRGDGRAEGSILRVVNRAHA